MADPSLHLSETPCRRGSLTPRKGSAIILRPAPNDGQRPFGLFGTIDRVFWRGRSALKRCKTVQFLLGPSTRRSNASRCAPPRHTIGRAWRHSQIEQVLYWGLSGANVGWSFISHPPRAGNHVACRARASTVAGKSSPSALAVCRLMVKLNLVERDPVGEQTACPHKSGKSAGGKPPHPNRNLAPDCRVEACTSPLAAARRDLYIAEQAIDCCSADRENTMTIHLAKLQSPVLFKRWQQIGIITLNRLPH